MVSQGSGGAFEISQRMTAMVGWGATTGFAEDWAWQQSADTYALDPEMAARLRKANPQVRIHDGEAVCECVEGGRGAEREGGVYRSASMTRRGV